MKPGEALYKAMEKTKTTYKMLADILGKPVSTIKSRAYQENISVALLNEMAGKVGYKVMLVPKKEEENDDKFRIE